jgi:hypothetical protein
MYKQYKDLNGNIAQGVVRTTDGAAIPFDPANTDYQEYLKWVALGNEPISADTPTEE